MEALAKVDELITLIDGPCECDDGTCRLCRIMDLLFCVRAGLAAQSPAGSKISAGTWTTSPPNRTSTSSPT
jgi:hypothetical protein